jgi:hypothetical protein
MKLDEVTTKQGRYQFFSTAQDGCHDRIRDCLYLLTALSFVSGM